MIEMGDEVWRLRLQSSIEVSPGAYSPPQKKDTRVKKGEDRTQGLSGSKSVCGL